MEVCSAEEASRVLSECGYPELSELSLGGIERMLAASRGELRKDLRESAPDSKVVDLFFIPYDYHNVKVVLKAKATGQDADRLFIDCGRYPAAQLKEEVLQGTLQHETAVFTQAAMSAEAALDQDSSPQAADQILDRACAGNPDRYHQLRRGAARSFCRQKRGPRPARLSRISLHRPCHAV